MIILNWKKMKEKYTNKKQNSMWCGLELMELAIAMIRWNL